MYLHGLITTVYKIKILIIYTITILFRILNCLQITTKTSKIDKINSTTICTTYYYYNTCKYNYTNKYISSSNSLKLYIKNILFNKELNNKLYLLVYNTLNLLSNIILITRYINTYYNNYFPDFKNYDTFNILKSQLTDVSLFRDNLFAILHKSYSSFCINEFKSTLLLTFDSTPNHKNTKTKFRSPISRAWSAYRPLQVFVHKMTNTRTSQKKTFKELVQQGDKIRTCINKISNFNMGKLYLLMDYICTNVDGLDEQLVIKCDLVEEVHSNLNLDMYKSIVAILPLLVNQKGNQKSRSILVVINLLD